MIKKVIFCNCGAKIIGADRLSDISAYLNQTGNSVVEVADLCGCSVDRKGELRELFLAGDKILIIACFPRAVHLLLGNCGIDYNCLNLSYLNFRELNNDQIFLEISNFFTDDPTSYQSNYLPNPSDWPSWFPLIDHSRCNSCGQCADFCLFGVFEKVENRVVVVHPKGCKNSCPACGRICPQTAIIFPKYDHGGAIAGSDTIDEMAEQQRQNNDIDTILGSNIYKALEMRKAKRESIIRNAAMQKAIAEREKALAGKSDNQ